MVDKKTPVAHCVTCMCADCESDRFPRPSCFQIRTIYDDSDDGRLDCFQICEDCIKRLAKQQKDGVFRFKLNIKDSESN